MAGAAIRAISWRMIEIAPVMTCPRCRAPMRLARVWHAAFGQPELRSYACTQCPEAVTVEAGDSKEPAGVTGCGVSL